MIIEEIKFYGHENIKSLHSRTIEVTKDNHLTPNGDCIIGVKANKACSDFVHPLKSKITSEGSRIEIEIIVEPFSFVILAKGNAQLTLKHTHDIVLRKSNYTCDRTAGVSCNYSSIDIPRKMVNSLKDSSKSGLMRISVE